MTSPWFRPNGFARQNAPYDLSSIYITNVLTIIYEVFRRWRNTVENGRFPVGRDCVLPPDLMADGVVDASYRPC